MMETIHVALGQRSYRIHIGSQLLDELGDRVRDVVPVRLAALVSDKTVFDLYGERAVRSLTLAGYKVCKYIIDPGDQSKSLAVAQRIYDALYEAELDRNSPLIALGGGVVGDLTGFVAGTWLRGVPFIQVPTTIEAAVDASVGGKTAVNHPRGKNLIGVFHQPCLVLMDTDTLKTLSDRDVRAGLAESIKHGMIRDAGFFALHEAEAERILALDNAVLEKVLSTNCRIKADVVSADEREAGLRAILNFGHTVGHAIEVAGGYGKYRHGEAVSLGMVAASFIAERLGRFGAEELDRLERLLRRFYLPTRQRGLDADVLIDVMRRDKKVRAGKIRFVLPLCIGRVDVFDDIPTELIRESIGYLGVDIA